MLSFRFGIHHFSGHYGDELLEKYCSYNRVNADDRFNGGSAFLYPNAVTGHEYYLIEPVEYVRDNSWIMGLSADVPIASRFSVRVYHHQRLAVLKLLVSCGCACAGRQTCPISRSNLVPPGEQPLPKRTCFSHMAAAKPCDLSLRHAFPATVLDILKKRIVTCIAISDAWRNLF